MAEESPLIQGRQFRLCATTVAALVSAATGLHGQDPVRGDTLVETLPDSVRDVFGQARRTEPQAFPERRGGLRGPATEVFECDRECIQASTALSLLDLLSERVPGIRPLRAGFFAGPHHLFDGPYGAGFVTLWIDGREVPSLERAQTDFRRLSLSYVESVRVYREAAGLIVDVDTYRHDSAVAFSRIAGSTGSPSLQTLEGAFANGLSRAFTVQAAFELLDAEAGGVENDRFEALARLSWMPASNDFGVQVEYRTETVDRTAADTADLRRNTLLFRARGNLGEEGQLELYGALSNYRLKVQGLADDEDPPTRDVDVLGARLSTRLGAGRATLGARLSGGAAYPSFQGELSSAYPVGPLWLEGGLDFGNWTDFSASSWRAAAALSDTVLVPVTVRAFASSGDRGIGFAVLDTAESVGFSAYGIGGGFEAGPFQVSGRYTIQRLDRQLRLGASFDSVAALDSTRVDITSWEARLEGPLIPIGGVISGLDPIRVRAFYRRNSASGALPLYQPATVARAELILHDSFFRGNLDLWLSGFIERRGQRLLPRAGETDPALVSGYTWPGGHVMIKIGDLRLFYRFENPAGQRVFDIPGSGFPINVGLFGLRWEFFN